MFVRVLYAVMMMLLSWGCLEQPERELVFKSGEEQDLSSGANVSKPSKQKSTSNRSQSTEEALQAMTGLSPDLSESGENIGEAEEDDSASGNGLENGAAVANGSNTATLNPETAGVVIPPPLTTASSGADNAEQFWGSWVLGSCANGATQRIDTRQCESADSSKCKGDTQRISLCPIDGGWSAWQAVPGACDPAQERPIEKRFCNNPAPLNGGKLCGPLFDKDQESRVATGSQTCDYEPPETDIVKSNPFINYRDLANAQRVWIADVLISYTPTAAKALGDLDAHAQGLVAGLNTILSNSGISDLSFRVVATIPLEEEGDLRKRAGTYMPLVGNGIQNLTMARNQWTWPYRDAFGADFSVTVYGDNEGSTSYAYVAKDLSPDDAYSVLRVSSTGYHLTHEIAHNVSNQHCRIPSTADSAYRHGFPLAGFTAQGFAVGTQDGYAPGTIQCGNSIALLSDPSRTVQFQGNTYKIGNEQWANEKRVWEETITKTVNFRKTRVPLDAVEEELPSGGQNTADEDYCVRFYRYDAYKNLLLRKCVAPGNQTEIITLDYPASKVLSIGVGKKVYVYISDGTKETKLGTSVDDLSFYDSSFETKLAKNAKSFRIKSKNIDHYEN